MRAHAAVKEGERPRGRGELWEHKRRLEEELGDWVHDAWMAANGMHACLYEGWCTAEHVEAALKRMEGLVDEVKRRL